MSAAATQDPSLLGSWDSVYQTNSTNNIASAGSTATSGQAFLGQRLNAGGIPRNASTPNLEALAKADPFADLGLYLPINKISYFNIIKKNNNYLSFNRISRECEIWR